MSKAVPGPPWRVLLMIRGLGVGGTERQLSLLAQTLDRRWFEPYVGCFIDSGIRSAELDRAGVPVKRFPVTSFRSISAWRGARQLRNFVRTQGISLVHAFDYPACVFAVPALWLGSPARLVSSQRFHRHLVGPGMQLLLRVAHHMAQLVVVNSMDVRRHMIEDFGMPDGRLRVCYNILDLDEFNPPPAGPRPRTGALSGAALVIGVVCGFRPEKNLPLLLRAYARIRPLHPGIKLLLVGDGPARNEIVQLASELGLGDDCIFHPAVDRVASWLRQIDIFVLPSLSEALSNSILEAMACGCAVIASRVGGNPELIEGGVNGLLFTSGDAEDLTARLRQVIEDPLLRHSLAERGAADVRRRFSREAAAASVAAVYLEALGVSPTLPR